MPYYGRTDLAEEAHRQHRSQSGNPAALSGVRVEKEQLFGLPVTTVEIGSKEGERALGKARGRYYHLRLPAVFPSRGEAFEDAVRALAALIRRCLPSPAPRSALVAALGNPDVTPDALGPLCAESVLVTRHLQKDPMFQRFTPVSLCRTGVLGTSGMESAFQIQTLSRALQPDCVLAVDALAGLDPEELCRCVQVCDAGIAPGSGVGNNREMLSRETLGIPVLALGVPTVIDAASLSEGDGLSSLFVTPRWIDSAVRQYARLLGYAINAALQPGLAVADMDLLLA
jgi:spore protease